MNMGAYGRSAPFIKLMDNIKLSLCIILPGGVMYSKAEVLKPLDKVKRNKYGKIIKRNGKPVYTTEYVEDFTKHNSFTLKITDENNKEVPITVLVRSTKPAKQVLNLTQEAYDYMISREQPYGFKGNWNALNIQQKLKWHCFNIAQQLGGYCESFQVMD